MEHDSAHDVELYLLEVFNILFEHEVRKSRRYEYPVSVICIAIEAEPDTLQTRHAAELIAINAFDVELRDSDVPCRDGHEFLILLPSTDEKSAHHACKRLERALNSTSQTTDGAAFQVSAYIGLASNDEDLSLTPKQLLELVRHALNQARAKRSLTTVLASTLK